MITLISSFSLTKFLLVPCASVSIKATGSVLLSLFELKAILVISSLKKFSFSIVPYEYFMIFLRRSISEFFFLDILFYFQA